MRGVRRTKLGYRFNFVSDGAPMVSEVGWQTDDVMAWRHGRPSGGWSGLSKREEVALKLIRLGRFEDSLRVMEASAEPDQGDGRPLVKDSAHYGDIARHYGYYVREVEKARQDPSTHPYSVKTARERLAAERGVKPQEVSNELSKARKAEPGSGLPPFLKSQDELKLQMVAEAYTSAGWSECVTIPRSYLYEPSGRERRIEDLRTFVRRRTLLVDLSEEELSSLSRAELVDRLNRHALENRRWIGLDHEEGLRRVQRLTFVESLLQASLAVLDARAARYLPPSK